MRTLLLIIVLFAVIVQGQTKPPQTYSLNPDASATWQRIAQSETAENARHQKEIDRLNELRAVMLQAASIPAEAWSQCKADDKGIVICAKPESAKASSSPEKRP